MGKAASSSWSTWKRGATIKTKRRSKRTFRAQVRKRRQPFVEQCGITERGARAQTCPEGQSCCSGWPFVQGILGCSKRRGVRKRPELRQTAARNPRFEREVKFCAVLCLCY